MFGRGGAPGALILADLVCRERGGPCVAAEEGGEMGGPATGGADGPELSHLIVLEIGVDEIPQGRPLGGCFRHQLLLPSPYLVLTKPLRLDIQCQRAASVNIGWKYLDD